MKVHDYPDVISKMIPLFSPRWLFLVPGIFLSALGVIFAGALSLNDIKIGGVAFDVGTLAVACMTVIIGFQLVAFAFFTPVFAHRRGVVAGRPEIFAHVQIFHARKRESRSACSCCWRGLSSWCGHCGFGGGRILRAICSRRKICAG